MKIDITVLVGFVGTVISIWCMLVKWKKDGAKQESQETKEQTILSTKLDYISKNIDDIKVDLRARAKENAELKERLIKVEESTKSAHKRIDEIEER
ncbi:hypothetical protein [Clostridium thermobutyricum]|uniref:hypothetical protein n=1 Tax=Clostridium thermobutyricum TaxID=29372 RepID=UPI0018AB93C3|nr:hypothetical protein [Clostridium thermobutyricum]